MKHSSQKSTASFNTVAETQNRDLSLYLLANFSMGLSAALMILL